MISASTARHEYQSGFCPNHRHVSGSSKADVGANGRARTSAGDVTIRSPFLITDIPSRAMSRFRPFGIHDLTIEPWLWQKPVLLAYEIRIFFHVHDPAEAGFQCIGGVVNFMRKGHPAFEPQRVSAQARGMRPSAPRHPGSRARFFRRPRPPHRLQAVFPGITRAAYQGGDTGDLAMRK